MGYLTFGILVPIPQEKKDKVISLKCCHSELGLELAEHRDSCESPVTIGCCSLPQPRCWPFLGVKTRGFQEGMLTHVRPRVSSHSHHSPGRTDELGENAGLL